MKQMTVTEKRIGDATYYIKPFPAFTAAGISGDLAALVTPIVSSLASIFGGEQQESFDIMNLDMQSVAPVVSDAFSALSGDKIEMMMLKLLIQHKNVSVECEMTENRTTLMTMDIANEVFCGELQNMYLLCFEVIRINYGGFFKKLGDLFGNLQLPDIKTTSSSNNTVSST